MKSKRGYRVKGSRGKERERGQVWERGRTDEMMRKETKCR